MSSARRCWCAAAALVGALLLPATAFAHVGKSAPVATNFQARIESVQPASSAVEAKAVDGDRGLWLRIDRQATVVIPGAAGEPLLRFDPKGVFVNLRSLTAQSDGIDRFDLRPDPNLQARPLWHRLTSGHAYLWHEHRLHMLEPLARGRHRKTVLGRWSVPLLIDGRRHALAGVLLYRPPGSAWPWFGLAAALAAALVAARAISASRGRQAALTAALVATLLVWAVRIGRELYGRPTVGVTGYIEIALTSLVGAALLYGLAQRDQGVRLFTALLVGVGCLYQALTMWPVLTHAIALTTLPTAIAQPAVAAILGLSVGVLAITLREQLGADDGADVNSERKTKSAVRPHVAADLEHKLVPIAQHDPTRVAVDADTVSVETKGAAKGKQPRLREPFSPHAKELSQRGLALVMDDTARVSRPQGSVATRADRPSIAELRIAQPDACRHDHDTPIGEQLEMDATARRQRPCRTPSVTSWTWVVARTRTDRNRKQRPRQHEPQHNRHTHRFQRRIRMARIVPAMALASLAVLAAGCGSSSPGPAVTVQAAHVYHLSGFTPAGPVAANKPTTVSFTIVQPNGQPLTAYRHGAGPHNGVHLIVVRRDLGVIIHHHPPVGANGKLTDTITFPAPGPYRVVIDAYPKNAGVVPSFQLFQTVRVKGAYTPKPLPPFEASETIDGYHFALQGAPQLHAVQASLLDFTVTGPDGAPAKFTPWFGALAHAVFFRAGTLDYFHTHVCAPGAGGCASVLGSARITGTSATPGHLQVGLLLPLAGTWRLFLQCQLNGKVVTAPFTLHVS